MGKLTIKEVKEKIKRAHGDVVILDESTYKNTYTKCRFVDKNYGEWWICPKVVFKGRGHPERTRLMRIDIFMTKYGVKSFMETEEFREKARQTNLKRYGVENPQQNKEINEKTKQTRLKRYGVEYLLQNKEIKEKAKQTCLRNYGVENPTQNKEILEKSKQTCLKNYGVKNPQQNKEIKERTKQTNLKRYGVENPFQSEEIKEKSKQTMLEKYGVEHAMQNPEIALKVAKAQNNSSTLIHWFSHEDIVCIAGWEKKTVEYFNKNKIDYNWQVQTFLMPDGRTFRPDCYLPDQDLWIEIKGYFRDDAQEKWEWFHNEYPNSELWDKVKLEEMNIL